jgi:hypothetical protein
VTVGQGHQVSRFEDRIDLADREIGARREHALDVERWGRRRHGG